MHDNFIQKKQQLFEVWSSYLFTWSGPRPKVKGFASSWLIFHMVNVELNSPNLCSLEKGQRWFFISTSRIKEANSSAKFSTMNFDDNFVSVVHLMTLRYLWSDERDILSWHDLHGLLIWVCLVFRFFLLNLHLKSFESSWVGWKPYDSFSHLPVLDSKIKHPQMGYNLIARMDLL